MLARALRGVQLATRTGKLRPQDGQREKQKRRGELCEHRVHEALCQRRKRQNRSLGGVADAAGAKVFLDLNQKILFKKSISWAVRLWSIPEGLDGVYRP